MLYLLVLFSFLVKYRILLEPLWGPESCATDRVSDGIFAKDQDVKLDDHVPQVLTQLYASATMLKSGSHLYFLLLPS